MTAAKKSFDCSNWWSERLVLLAGGMPSSTRKGWVMWVPSNFHRRPLLGNQQLRMAGDLSLQRFDSDVPGKHTVVAEGRGDAVGPSSMISWIAWCGCTFLDPGSSFIINQAMFSSKPTTALPKLAWATTRSWLFVVQHCNGHQKGPETRSKDTTFELRKAQGSSNQDGEPPWFDRSMLDSGWWRLTNG